MTGFEWVWIWVFLYIAPKKYSWAVRVRPGLCEGRSPLGKKLLSNEKSAAYALRCARADGLPARMRKHLECCLAAHTDRQRSVHA